MSEYYTPKHRGPFTRKSVYSLVPLEPARHCKVLLAAGWTGNEPEIVLDARRRAARHLAEGCYPAAEYALVEGARRIARLRGDIATLAVLNQLRLVAPQGDPA